MTEKRCRECGQEYSESEIRELLIELFGGLEHIDEDCLVENYGLCPSCWVNSY